jgi:hypothetical protein
MDLILRYHEVLNHIPPPGRGCHVSLLSVANRGVLAGLDGEKIFADIRGHIPPGRRRVSDREIQEAISKALHGHNATTFTPQQRPVPIVRDGKVALQRIINQGQYTDEAALREASPVRIPDDSDSDATLFLATLYQPNDLVWIGEPRQVGIRGTTIRTRDEWIAYYRDRGTKSPHIILNPLSGLPAPKKSGYGTTLRGDANVLSYRYCLVEFDTLSRANQIRFWSSFKIPIVALIDSGNKSIHAVIDVQKLAKVKNADQWQTCIKGHLYERTLVPLGADGACSNPSRLSRLPGHFREEKKAWQRLLWLAPEGRPLCH